MGRMIRTAWGIITYGPFVLLAIAAVAFVVLFREAGDGFYRYPCQDPALWDSPSCNPPLCQADNTCTDYLINRETNP